MSISKNSQLLLILIPALALGAILSLLSTQKSFAERQANITVIAHRGASGYRPEHTLKAYELAIDLGADYIEPDLVPTKDGVLVARHENEISGTSDVEAHKEFADRKTKKLIDGEQMEGWFVEDFTLAELKTLKAQERMPQLRHNNTIYNSLYTIPTLQEIIDLVKRKSTEKHREIGLYIELKHPSYFRCIKNSSEEPLLEALQKNSLNSKDSKVFIQCFEPGALKRLHKATELPLIQLILETGSPFDLSEERENLSFSQMTEAPGLARIARYASGIGPNKDLICPRDKDGNLLPASSLILDAHKAGLLVHPWTFRNENQFLPADFKHRKNTAPDRHGNALSEYRHFYELGVDGVFSENPDTAIEARDSSLM